MSESKRSSGARIRRSRSRAKRAVPTLLLGAGVLITSGAHAQFPSDQPTRLPALGRSAVSDDDSTALVVNPANLAFIPGAELRWNGMFLNEDSTASYQGHAFSTAFPIQFLRLSTGLRLDIVSPPRLSDYPAPTSVTTIPVMNG